MGCERESVRTSIGYGTHRARWPSEALQCSSYMSDPRNKTSVYTRYNSGSTLELLLKVYHSVVSNLGGWSEAFFSMSS